jgi:hypothetical protein
MSEDEKPFTVTDRRHFTSEGRARQDEEEKPASQDEKPAPAAASAADEDIEDREEPAGGGPVLDFAGLLVSLGAQAQLLMAGDPSVPGGGPPDLAGARGFISLLETLKEKTEGRRTPDEDHILDALLYQLRLEYVARSKTVGA